MDMEKSYRGFPILSKTGAIFRDIHVAISLELILNFRYKGASGILDGCFSGILARLE
jgi:hypothetical protein